jgi:hypothetical protein
MFVLKNNFNDKIICYVQDERTNLFAMTTILKHIVSCENLKVFILVMPFLRHVDIPLPMKQ